MNKKEDESNFNYELSVKSIVDPYIYILVKKESSGKIICTAQFIIIIFRARVLKGEVHPNRQKETYS